MNGTKDTLEKKLSKSAQAIGSILLRASLGIETTGTLEDVYSQANYTALEWAIQGTDLTEKRLLEYIESSDYKDTKDHKEATERYFEAMRTFKKLNEPYESLMNKLSTKRNNIYFVREETEQNAWRMAYFIKELRMSELQKKHNEPIDNEEMLLENLTKDDMQSIQQSHHHIALGLATVYAWQDLVKFLSEYFKDATLTTAIEKDAPSEAPIKVLRAEAGRTKDFITEYAFEWKETEEKERVIRGTIDSLDKAINYYMPLIMFNYLLDIKRTNKESYKEISSVYADYTVKEITESIEQILTRFTREIMKQNKGAK